MPAATLTKNMPRRNISRDQHQPLFLPESDANNYHSRSFGSTHNMRVSLTTS